MLHKRGSSVIYGMIPVYGILNDFGQEAYSFFRVPLSDQMVEDGSVLIKCLNSIQKTKAFPKGQNRGPKGKKDQRHQCVPG